MLWVIADDAHDALAVDNLALLAHFFYWRPDFHNCLLRERQTANLV